MYGNDQLVAPGVSDHHGGEPQHAHERHGAQLKTAKGGRHARHKSRRPFAWLHPHHERSH